MHSLQANYDFTVTVIHYPYLKTTSKIIPLNQYKFQILNQNKEARRQPGGEYTYEQQSNLYHHVLIQVNMMHILNITKSLQ